MHHHTLLSIFYNCHKAVSVGKIFILPARQLSRIGLLLLYRHVEDCIINAFKVYTVVIIRGLHPQP